MEKIRKLLLPPAIILFTLLEISPEIKDSIKIPYKYRGRFEEMGLICFKDKKIYLTEKGEKVAKLIKSIKDSLLNENSSRYY